MFSGTYFVNSEFTILKKKKVLERIIWNGFLPSRFSIMETHFVYGTSIPKTYLAYATFFPESPKIIKDNPVFSKNVGVQEEIPLKKL